MDEHASHKGKENADHNPYRRLLLMTLISFVAMYGLMYAMVDALGNVFNNFNQFYMAGLMAAAMVLIELVVMLPMYPKKRLNILFFGAGALALGLFWVAIRSQFAISDTQFLRSMIPHHASAILMCEEASIEDPEIKRLCEQIIEGQSREIAQMKTKLDELSRKEKK